MLEEVYGLNEGGDKRGLTFGKGGEKRLLVGLRAFELRDCF
jgi:hypothetical protein